MKKKTEVKEFLATELSTAKTIQNQVEASLQTSAIGEVVTYDPKTQRATIRPLVKDRGKGEGKINNRQMPLLYNVPVFTLGGGGYGLAFPLEKGDEGLILYLDRDSDGWKEHGSVQQPATGRRHHVKDGVFIPGIRSKAKALALIEGDKPQTAGNWDIKGEDGKSAYQLAVEQGFKGNEKEYLDSLTGKDGQSIYELAKEQGYEGTEEEYVEQYQKAYPLAEEFGGLGGDNFNQGRGNLMDITSLITSENLNDFTFFRQFTGRTVAYITNVETQNGALAPTSWGILTTERAGTATDFTQQWQDALGNVFIRGANNRGWNNDIAVAGKDAWQEVFTRKNFMPIYYDYAQVTDSTYLKDVVNAMPINSMLVAMINPNTPLVTPPERNNFPTHYGVLEIIKTNTRFEIALYESSGSPTIGVGNHFWKARLNSGTNEVVWYKYHGYLNNTVPVGAKHLNGYWGLTDSAGVDTGFYRTPVSGLLPYQSGGGTSQLGTGAWPFSAIWGKTIYENGVSLASKYATLNHNHTTYATLNHNHTTYAALNHNHATYAPLAGAIQSPILVARNTNINNIMTYGFYYNPGNADVVTMANNPDGNAFGMFVMRTAGVVQVWFPYIAQSSIIYTRRYYNGTWGKWVKYLGTYL